jgi:hypothetical protein
MMLGGGGKDKQKNMKLHEMNLAAPCAAHDENIILTYFLHFYNF